MNQDVVPADKTLRKKFIIFFVLFTKKSSDSKRNISEKGGEVIELKRKGGETK